jgi:AraC-like DNA-binding protein
VAANAVAKPLFFTRDEGERSAVSRFWRSHDREISVHLFRYPSGVLDCPDHKHGEFSITIGLEARLSYRVGNIVETVEKGEVLIIPPGEWHSGIYSSTPTPAGITVSVSELILKRLLFEMRTPLDLEKTSIALPGIVGDRYLSNLALELAAEIEAGRPGYSIVIASLVTQLLVYLLRCVQPSPMNDNQTQQRGLPSFEMVRTIEIMNSYGKRAFSLPRLCFELGTSPSRFVQLFNKSTDASPLAFFNRLLIRKAKHLLGGSDLSIKEVACALEFQSDSHFCNLFRDISGVSPMQFRLSDVQAP